MIANNVFHLGLFNCSLNDVDMGEILRLPQVNSGRSLTGSMALNSMPIRIELIILFFATPGMNILPFEID